MVIDYQIRHKLFNVAFKSHHERLQSIFEKEIQNLEKTKKKKKLKF